MQFYKAPTNMTTTKALALLCIVFSPLLLLYSIWGGFSWLPMRGIYYHESNDQKKVTLH